MLVCSLKKNLHIQYQRVVLRCILWKNTAGTLNQGNIPDFTSWACKNSTPSRVLSHSLGKVGRKTRGNHKSSGELSKKKHQVTLGSLPLICCLKLSTGSVRLPLAQAHRTHKMRIFSVSQCIIAKNNQTAILYQAFCVPGHLF
jgi:hypothetical protein